ncbi:MAG TPA: phosphoribosylformylglycinamidine synthase subunit PurS [Actinomycetota bacterium]|nr:phosphoribosylformylglycinamidine synthase subunit PurS [Actinomycetota bacterium]
MRFLVELVVSLKEGLLDPQGKAVEGALPALGWENVDHVRVGKYIRLVIEAPDRDAAIEQSRSMAERFLSNPVIEDFHVVDVTEQPDLVAGGRA